MVTLAILDAKKVINKYDLPYETSEIILDMQCDKDDPFCRGEKCCH